MTGALAFFALARRGDVFQAALFGCVGVYLIGVVAPHLTASPVMFDLHLLRSGGPIHMMATLGGLALATTWLGSREKAESRVLGPLLMAALLATYWAHFVWTAMAANAESRDRVAQWSMVGEWARANTPADVAFLVPTANGRDAALMLDNTLEPDNVQLGADIFEYASHRRVWVTFKRGAAVMWTQSYYPIWHARVADVLRLASLDQTLNYAARNGIAYVVAACAWNDGQPVLFRTRLLCVFQVPPS